MVIISTWVWWLLDWRGSSCEISARFWSWVWVVLGLFANGLLVMFWPWVVIDGGGGFDESKCGWLFSGIANRLWLLVAVGERERESKKK